MRSSHCHYRLKPGDSTRTLHRRQIFTVCSLGCLLQLATVSPAQTAESAAPPIAVHSEQSKPVKPQVADDPEARDYTTRRYEPAGFPLLGGDSDIGFEFGVVGTLSRFGDGVMPYRWNMDLILALSVKNSPTGNEVTQQSYQWNVDVPNLDGGRIRINPQLMYYRTVNQLYFGLGNASGGRLPPGTTLRHFEFDERQARLRVLTRFKLHGPLSLMLGNNYRFENPHPYAGSRLQSDAAAGVIRGVRPLHLFTQAVGLVFDSRDNEIFPHSGVYGDIGVRTTVGAPVDEGVRYGGAGLRIAKYTTLGGPAILATRGVVDLEYGKVPVFDLYTGGVFFADEMVGGSSSVRGVPDGRYAGLIKAYINVELRAMLLHVSLFGQRFALGGNLLFDTGRLWSDYTFHSPLDGSGIGLKWGAGGGAYLQWGQAAVFRLEVAYSPDAISENPGLPIGIYVEDGVMF